MGFLAKYMGSHQSGGTDYKKFTLLSTDISSDTIISPVFSGVGANKGSVVIGDLAIEWGQESITSGTSSSNSVYVGSATITFTNTFSSNPTVMVTFSGNYTNQKGTAVASVSTTGATIYGYISASNQSRTLKWLAIGKKA